MDVVQQHDELDDAELIHRSQARDFPAYEKLIRRYYNKIYGLVYGMTSHRDEAADLVQEIFIKSWRSLGQFREQSSVCIWIYRIAIRRAIMYCLKQPSVTTQKINHNGLDSFDPAVKQSASYRTFSSKGSIWHKINLGMFQKKMNEALLNLPTKNRAMIVMHDVQGMPLDEIADVMHCSEKTVYSHLTAARKWLRTVLGKETLLSLKAYERPNEDRVEKNIQNIMRKIRSVNNRPGWLFLPEKGMAWLLARPRYGIAALFILFLGLHLMERPLPKPTIGLNHFEPPKTITPIVNPTNASPVPLPHIQRMRMISTLYSAYSNTSNFKPSNTN